MAATDEPNATREPPAGHERASRMRCVSWADHHRPPRGTIPFLSVAKTDLAASALAQAPVLHVFDAYRVRPLATAWVAQHADGLFVAIDVRDDQPIAAGHDQPFDTGDAVEVRLRLGLAEHGACMAVGRAETIDARDATLQLAVSPAGPQARLLVGDAPTETMLSHDVTMTRDETQRLTLYRVLVPWQALQSAPGAQEGIGVGVLVHARHDAAHPRQTYRSFVDAAGGHRPSALLPLRLAEPPAPYAVISPVLVRQGTTNDDLVVRVRGRAPIASLEATSGAWRESCPLGDGVFDVAVQLRPEVHAQASATSVFSLRASMADEQVLARARVSPAPSWPTLHAARARLQALEASMQESGLSPSVAARGLRHASVLRTLLERQRSLAFLGSVHEQQAQWNKLDELATAIAQVPMSAEHDPWDLDLRAGRRATLEAVYNPVDNALASAALFVPTTPIPKGESRPLIVFLHGRGDPSESRFVKTFVEPSEDALPDAFVLVPWARGNQGAQGAGESDVLALIETMQARYPIDPDAISLMGFSLGGSGAFSLALHAPQHFSAVAIAAGGAWNVPLGQGLGRNARSVPFFLWHGGADNVIPLAEQARIIAELQAHHVTYEAHVETHAGHVLSPALKARMTHFVLSKRRERPSRYEYVADGPSHRGRDGISLSYDAMLSPFPSFCVERGALGWHIKSRNTEGLEISPGDDVNAAPNATLEVRLPKTKTGHASFAPRSVGIGAARP